MSGLVALRLARGGAKDAVQILRALAYDNQTANFTAGLVVTGTGVKATQTADFASNVLNTLTITIGGKTYTFQDSLTNVDGNVLVGANAQASIDNLVAAVNLAAGGGSTYAAATTAHPNVSAVKVDADTIRFTALVAGTAGNAIALTETGSVITATGALLAGGINASGASGILVEQTDGGATGSLILRDIKGEFTDNELVTDSSTGSALANGVLTTPLLTPSDALILQADLADFKRGEAFECIQLLRQALIEAPWHGGNGFLAFRVTRGALADQVERLGLLAYDGQSVNFVEGLVVTGGTSAATGTLVDDVDGGSAGTLLLRNIRGIFVNDEAITDSGTGAAVANGAQTTPLLTPDDQLILQGDFVDYTKAEALEGLKQLELAVMDMQLPYRAAA